MKKSSTLFLKSVLCLTAILILTALVWFPRAEGRAANLDLISIYSDPFILYIYLASLPFFAGLYEAFRLLGLIDHNKAFSKEAIGSLKKMKYASLCLIGFILLAVLYIRLFVRGDDPAGPTGLGIFLSFVFGVIATAIGVTQKLLQSGLDMKSENDLTI